MPDLCTATQEPLRIKNIILFHVLLGALYNRVWFGTVRNLAVDMLLATAFIDCFIRRIFPTKRKVVPWHLHPVLILSATQRDQFICTTISHVAAPLGKQSSDDEASSHQFLIARKTVLKPHSNHFVVVPTTASGTNTFESKVFEGICQITFATHGVIDVLPSQLFNILATNFSAIAVLLPKHTVVPHATGSLKSVMTALSTPLHQSPIGIQSMLTRSQIAM